jgi:hypothetical protein
MNFLQLALLSLVNATLAVFLLQKIKNFCISTTFSINRETELQGENVSISGQAYFWDSAESRFQKLNELAETAVERKGYCFSRYEQILREEQAANVQQMKKKD